VDATTIKRKQRHERVARYRARLRNGRGVLRVEVPLNAVAETAIRIGVLTEEQALDRRNLERVAEGVMAAWLKEFANA
jgi:hypothetical protein